MASMLDSALLPTGAISTLSQPNVAETFELGLNAFDTCFVVNEKADSLDTRQVKPQKVSE